MCEIKYIKNTSPWRTSNAVDPAKCGLKRTRIERDMLNFYPEETRACRSPRGLMGLMATSFLGTRGLPAHLGSPPPLACDSRPCR